MHDRAAGEVGVVGDESLCVGEDVGQEDVNLEVDSVPTKWVGERNCALLEPCSTHGAVVGERDRRGTVLARALREFPRFSIGHVVCETRQPTYSGPAGAAEATRRDLRRNNFSVSEKKVLRVRKGVAIKAIAQWYVKAK